MKVKSNNKKSAAPPLRLNAHIQIKHPVLEDGETIPQNTVWDGAKKTLITLRNGVQYKTLEGDAAFEELQKIICAIKTNNYD